VLLLAFSGLVAGLSGVCSVAYLDTAGPTGGTGYELSVLAAVIIGGVKLSGGRGSIAGVLLGLCVIGIFQNLIVLWGISPNWTQGVSGLVLIAAMTLTWVTKGRERGTCVVPSGTVREVRVREKHLGHRQPLALESSFVGSHEKGLSRRGGGLQFRHFLGTCAVAELPRPKSDGTAGDDDERALLSASTCVPTWPTCTSASNS